MPFKRNKRKRGAETKAGGVCAFVLLPKVSNHVGKLKRRRKFAVRPVLIFSGTPASLTSNFIRRVSAKNVEFNTRTRSRNSRMHACAYRRGQAPAFLVLSEEMSRFDNGRRTGTKTNTYNLDVGVRVCVCARVHARVISINYNNAVEAKVSHPPGAHCCGCTSFFHLFKLFCRLAVLFTGLLLMSLVSIVFLLQQ